MPSAEPQTMPVEAQAVAKKTRAKKNKNTTPTHNDDEEELEDELDFQPIRNLDPIIIQKHFSSLGKLTSKNWGEWASTLADQWSANEGILWEKTSPYTSTQNGRVERMNCTLMERVRALLSQRE
ncbi:uncharacterized protein MEPE_05949 [Melanopsichium pennsylvanicum]|uniref:Integrase catalytic domain-containing protein n=2 Tax=Melanopsichium pennsylvanicum TaxID=63383 RepID=A0AAJ5C884_9BASI|nr:tkp5 protein [Melanopsichium pennsylvanicum 4]SNX87239.1 uncharacterized protein MEPE_05949 [Melanopsichium pennsylvanicum]